MKHELQYPDYPTWCIHCGEFDVDPEKECTAERTRRFDSRIPENKRRVIEDMFGEVSQ